MIKLGIVISIFLGWQYMVGEYLGGILLILFSWLLIRLVNPKKLIKKAKENLGKAEEMGGSQKSFIEKLKSPESWGKVGMQYGMEWQMVWKDVTVGFTIAGIVAAFVPDSFFETLFINTGGGQNEFGFFTLLEHVLVGPLTAFLTFIGSMGNIPLAALLYGKGVSFAGVMAFIFSDLVVFPVLRINAKYYGWKMSFFILFLLFTSLIATSLLLHYGFNLFDLLPKGTGKSIVDQDHFKIDYSFYLNITFLALSGFLIYLGFFKKDMDMHGHAMAPKSQLLETLLKWAAIICYFWLAGGLVVKFFL